MNQYPEEYDDRQPLLQSDEQSGLLQEYNQPNASSPELQYFQQSEVRRHYQRTKYIKGAYFLAIFLIIFYFAIWPSIKPKKKNGFMNKSYLGYYYETETQSFSTKTDRGIANAALLRIFKDEGLSYTQEEIARLSDSFVLMLLESEDETEIKSLKAKVSILVDPLYRPVFVAVMGAINGDYRFQNREMRQQTYDLLVKYFNANQTPINVPLARWTDKLLIQTFRTLRLPAQSDFLY